MTEFHLYWGGESLCGVGKFEDLTTDWSHVTCKRCLKILEKKRKKKLRTSGITLKIDAEAADIVDEYMEIEGISYISKAVSRIIKEWHAYKEESLQYWG